jgi:hypothetical protein
VDDYTTFYISHMLEPAASCTMPTAQSSGVFVSRGLLDVSLGEGYLAFPQVENKLAASSGGSEVHLLQMREILVSLDLGEIPGSYTDSQREYSEKISGTMLPGGQTVVGPVRVVKNDLAAALKSVIPPNLQPVIVATLRVVAVKTGSTIESGPFPFPITLCSGCLVQYLNTQKTCWDAETPEGTVVSNTCGLPQDSPVTCCVDNSGGLARSKCKMTE